jgi:hypothetical protein
MGRECSTNEGEKEHIQVVAGIKRRNPLETPRPRRVDNFGEVGWGGLNWICLA